MASRSCRCSAYCTLHYDYRFILTVVDVFSRYGRPLKTKRGEEFAAAFEDIFKSGRLKNYIIIKGCSCRLLTGRLSKNLHLYLAFDSALKNTVSVLIYAVTDSLIEITQLLDVIAQYDR